MGPGREPAWEKHPPSRKTNPLPEVKGAKQMSQGKEALCPPPTVCLRTPRPISLPDSLLP